jgi:hypothetical protein
MITHVIHYPERLIHMAEREMKSNAASRFGAVICAG